MTDPHFGELTGIEEPRASCAVYVRRQLNEYSPFEEVFEFRAVEPEVSEAERDGKIASCQYYLTRESRNGNPGVDDIAASAGTIPAARVPDEVLERAAAMVEFMEPNPDWEDEEDESL